MSSTTEKVSTSLLPSFPNENNKELQQIIILLQEQNQTLQQLLQLQLKKDRDQFRNNLLHFSIQLIPYLALLILAYYIYNSLHGYLDTLNHNINILRDGFLSLQNSLGKLIPDFSGIKNTLENTWQNAQNIFN